eukprot:TRINITY_DN3422_c0_g1_i1.p1 TRINITY_DN3422_c0_g1~~TRINITY_DN3422_c0_g1_i1.p1  ORF type:complete len:339 (+),score=75.25 TRINITY_DN3422_c0_g1_i1:50-1066(+)
MSFSGGLSPSNEENPNIVVRNKKILAPIFHKYESIPTEGALNFLTQNRLKYLNNLQGILIEWTINNARLKKKAVFPFKPIVCIKGKFTILRVNKGDRLMADLVDIRNGTLIGKSFGMFLVRLDNANFSGKIGDQIEYKFIQYNLEDDLPVIQGKAPKIITKKNQSCPAPEAKKKSGKDPKTTRTPVGLTSNKEITNSELAERNVVATTQNEIIQELFKENGTNGSHTPEPPTSDNNEDSSDIELIKHVNKANKEHELICLDEDVEDSSEDEGRSPPTADNANPVGVVRGNTITTDELLDSDDGALDEELVDDPAAMNCDNDDAADVDDDVVIVDDDSS